MGEDIFHTACGLLGVCPFDKHGRPVFLPVTVLYLFGCLTALALWVEYKVWTAEGLVLWTYRCNMASIYVGMVFLFAKPLAHRRDYSSLWSSARKVDALCSLTIQVGGWSWGRLTFVVNCVLVVLRIVSDVKTRRMDPTGALDVLVNGLPYLTTSALALHLHLAAEAVELRFSALRGARCGTAERLVAHNTLTNMSDSVQSMFRYQVLFFFLNVLEALSQILSVLLSVAFAGSTEDWDLFRRLKFSSSALLSLLFQWKVINSLTRLTKQARKARETIYTESISQDFKDSKDYGKVQLFLTMNRQATFSACGFFNVDYTLAFAMIAGTTTYILVLSQMDKNWLSVN